MQVMTLQKPSQALFVFKGVGRIHPAHTNGMDGGYAQRDQDGHNGREDKEVPLDTDVPAEIFQPAVDPEPGKGPADEVGDHDEKQEFL
jgi:hypothetical protein